jgi:hypothetical protein
MTSPHLPSRILLIDRAREMVAAWRERFGEHDALIQS